MQKVSSKVVGLVLAFSMITLLSTPTPTKAQLDPFTGALLFGLAITQAAQIGAALGQASYDSNVNNIINDNTPNLFLLLPRTFYVIIY